MLHDDNPVEAYAGLDDEAEASAPEWPEHETELGVAQFFNALHGQDLRYVHVNDAFLHWNGRRWETDVDGAARRLVQEFSRGLSLAASRTSDHELRHRRMKLALTFETHQKQKAVLTLACVMKPIATGIDAFDNAPHLFNVQNGTIDLRTGQLREHRREDMISQISPIAYDPEARSPRWDAFISQVFPEKPSLVEFIQRAVGYSLTGESREDVFFILHGKGANGKSTFIKTVTHVLGDYAVSTSAETFVARKDNSATNDLARLHNARFVPAAEAGENKRLSEAFVKSVTGGDRVQARFLFREHFEFDPVFKVWLATNHRPKISGTDEGIWRRIRLIPFTARFSENIRDVGLLEKLQAEHAGILAWSVRGAQQYYSAAGLGSAPAVDEATAAYRSEMDTFGAFLDECFIRDPVATTTTAELVNAHKTWVAQNNEQSTMSGRGIALKLEELGFKKKDTRKARGFSGLRLRPLTLNGDARDAYDACEPDLPSSSYTRIQDGLVKTGTQTSQASQMGRLL